MKSAPKRAPRVASAGSRLTAGGLVASMVVM